MYKQLDIFSPKGLLFNATVKVTDYLMLQEGKRPVLILDNTIQYIRDYLVENEGQGADNPQTMSVVAFMDPQENYEPKNNEEAIHVNPGIPY